MQSLNFNVIIKRSGDHRPFIFNIVLWSLAFIILLFIFSKGTSPIKADHVYTFAFLLGLAIPVSINFYLLIPTFLKKEKYLIYSIGFTVNLVVFALLCELILVPILDILFPNYFFISYVSDQNIYLVFTIFLVATTLLKLAEDWFYFNNNENRLLKLKNQQIETQLSTLRAQINPHFLFNALNVIYALALEKQDGITNAIVQLSDVLRYIIYDSDTERVTLIDEVQLLQNYIAFQNHRIENPDAVHLHINVKDEQFKIYPMLLLPLLENSYKYGIISGEDAEPIRAELFQNANQFKFFISNTNLDTKNKIEDKYSGVGLENIKTNLELVYPKQHTFNVKATSKFFEVYLEINNESH